MKRIEVIARGNYSHKETSIRAAVNTNKSGKQYLEINARQLRSAADRVCYSGTDYLRIATVEGYGDFEAYEDGRDYGQRAFKI